MCVILDPLRTFLTHVMKNLDIFLVVSPCAICPLSKTVWNLSLACPDAELQSVTDRPSIQACKLCQVKLVLLRLCKAGAGPELSNNIQYNIVYYPINISHFMNKKRITKMHL